ncbi:MAG: antibiotic biosynthesis monooxygenase family protein [Aestuariivirga sp.]
MILEHAILNVRPGESPAFLLALEEALPLMTATPGFISMEVRPCLETPDRYVLLVRWETLEAHTVGFRGSDGYQLWRQKLHHFYDPFPTVEHYGDPVVSAP